MEITLQLFGAFRIFGETVTLQLPERAIVSDVRDVLSKKLFELDSKFNRKGLLDSSRFATEVEILYETSPLSAGATIAIIPPISGG